MLLKFAAIAVFCTPSTAAAPPVCFALKSTIDSGTCGGTGDLEVCDQAYIPVTPGGRTWGDGLVVNKRCYTLAQGEHTQTPCSVPPPVGYMRIRTGNEDDQCCDILATAGSIVGTITRPTGEFCLTTGGGG